MPIIADSTSPLPGFAIGRLEFICFDTFGAGSPIYATFADGSRELVWSGTAFEGLYARGSSAVFHTDRFRFSLRRVGGWPASQVRIDLDESVEDIVDDLVVIL